MNAKLLSWNAGAAALLLALASLRAEAGRPQPRETALIPREVFFPDGERMQSLQLSPDGKTLAYLARDAAGVLQVCCSQLDAQNGAPRCSSLGAPGASSPTWSPDGRSVLFQQRTGASQRLVARDVETQTDREILALTGAGIERVVSSARVEDELLLALRPKEGSETEVHRLDLRSGRLTLDTRNPGGVSASGFIADSALRIRAAARNVGEGATELLVRDAPDDAWRVWLTADQTHELAIESFAPGDGALLLRSDLRSDTARLVERDLGSGKERVIAGSDSLDAENVLRHPATGAVLAVSFLEDPRRWHVLDRALRRDLERLRRRLGPGQVNFGNGDRSGSRWLVWHWTDRRAPRCSLWDRAAGTTRTVYDSRPDLADLPLAATRPIRVKSRDGLALRGYLTLPVGAPRAPLPMVFWVHGGPYLRDAWGYDNIGQFFANRGYAFLRLNYRGSRGFGRSFRLASFKEWGGRMQDDVVDATRWAVARGIADPGRIAIVGHSYGGYVALAALTKTPELFACGAASSTTADLVTFVEQFPRTPDNAWVRQTIGDPAVERERELLRSVSPLHFVDRLRGPFVLARGDKDGALPPGEADRFVDALASRGKSVSYVVYEGDGHFFSRANQIDYMARVERLLARRLGGRLEPLDGDRYQGSSAKVRDVRMDAPGR